MSKKPKTGENLFFLRYQDAMENNLLIDIDKMKLTDNRLMIKRPSQHGAVEIEPIIGMKGYRSDDTEIYAEDCIARGVELLINIPAPELRELTNFNDQYATYVVELVGLTNGKYYEKRTEHQKTTIKLFEYGTRVLNAHDNNTVLAYPSPVEDGKLYINPKGSVIAIVGQSTVSRQNTLFDMGLGAGLYQNPTDKTLFDKYPHLVTEFTEIKPDVYEVTNKNYVLYRDNKLKLSDLTAERKYLVNQLKPLKEDEENTKKINAYQRRISEIDAEITDIEKSELTRDDEIRQANYEREKSDEAVFAVHANINAPMVYVAENPVRIFLHPNEIPKGVRVASHYVLRPNFLEEYLSYTLVKGENGEKNFKIDMPCQEFIRVINQNGGLFKELSLEEGFHIEAMVARENLSEVPPLLHNPNRERFAYFYECGKEDLENLPEALNIFPVTVFSLISHTEEGLPVWERMDLSPDEIMALEDPNVRVVVEINQPISDELVIQLTETGMLKEYYEYSRLGENEEIILYAETYTPEKTAEKALI